MNGCVLKELDIIPEMQYKLSLLLLGNEANEILLGGYMPPDIGGQFGKIQFERSDGMQEMTHSDPKKEISELNRKVALLLEEREMMLTLLRKGTFELQVRREMREISKEIYKKGSETSQ